MWYTESVPIYQNEGGQYHMKDEEEKVTVETPVVETPAAPGPETTPLTPTEGAVTLEGLHALVLELQGTVANLQAVADQATPVEPNAEEPPAETPDEAALLEEEPAAEEVSEEDLEEVDSLLQAN